MARRDRTLIEGPFTATANTTAVELEVPAQNYGQERMVLVIDESAGPIEIVTGDQIVGNTVPTTAAGDADFLAGEYRLGAAKGQLKAYASASTAFTYHWAKI